MPNGLFEERYARQLMLPDFGPESQYRLSEASILLVGVGGLGSVIAQLLCAAGVGKIVLADADTVSVSNLQRQILYRTDETGLSKIRCAAQSLKRLNPMVEIVGFESFFSERNALQMAQGCNIIVDGSDNAAARYLMNDLSVGLGIPYVYGSIAGFSGQAAVFNLRKTDATYRCVFPQPEPLPPATTTGVIGTLPAFIASIQANECLKILAGYGTPLNNRLFTCNLIDTTTACFQLQASETGRNVSLEHFDRIKNRLYN